MILTNLIALIFLIILVTTLASVVKGGPYVPSDQKTIKKILDFLQIKKGEKIADIGSGDGRIVIALAKKGALAYGYEINPLLVIWSKIKISRGGLKGKAFVYWKNFWKVDL